MFGFRKFDSFGQIYRQEPVILLIDFASYHYKTRNSTLIFFSNPWEESFGVLTVLKAVVTVKLRVSIWDFIAR